MDIHITNISSPKRTPPAMKLKRLQGKLHLSVFFKSIIGAYSSINQHYLRFRYTA
jgi:hypothetical protein